MIDCYDYYSRSARCNTVTAFFGLLFSSIAGIAIFFFVELFYIEFCSISIEYNEYITIFLLYCLNVQRFSTFGKVKLLNFL